MKNQTRILLPLVLLSFLLVVCSETSLSKPVATAPVVGPAAATPAGAGAIYYVAMGGSDGADGGEATPWRTIQHAVDTIQPGDTIWVQAGTYAQNTP